MQGTTQRRSFGIQRTAVLQSLTVPRTGKRILRVARDEAPRITYADLRHILRDFEDQNLVRCIYKSGTTGRIYHLTDQGLLKAKGLNPGFQRSPLPDNVDWPLFAKLCRSKTLHSVLSQLRRAFAGTERKTPTQVRKELLPVYPMSLSLTIGAISTLVDLGLATPTNNPERDSRLSYYTLTPKGRIYADLLSL